MEFTQKWNSVYNDNNVKLIKFHIILVILYGVLATLGFGLDVPFYGGIILATMSILHFITIFSVKNKLEIGRKVSETLGMIVLLGFPIGTLIGFFMLPKTTWEKPKDYTNRKEEE